VEIFRKLCRNIPEPLLCGLSVSGVSFGSFLYGKNPLLTIVFFSATFRGADWLAEWLKTIHGTHLK
jgi:hypothetical protein